MIDLPDNGWSPFFKRHPDNVKDKDRRGSVWGLCVHTSGSGVNKRAKQKGLRPDEVALDYYDDAKYSTHYVIGLDGCWQLTNDFERVQHVGFTDKKRHLSATQLRQWYLSGQWEEDLPAAFVGYWQKAWRNYKSPSHLFPSQWPSDDYVAVELIPCAGFAQSAFDGARYTTAQHVQVAALAVDLSVRHSWPEGWASTPRLCTHESLAPHNRVTQSGEGWDPGVLRDEPWFDWEMMQGYIRLFQLMPFLRSMAVGA